MRLEGVTVENREASTNGGSSSSSTFSAPPLGYAPGGGVPDDKAPAAGNRSRVFLIEDDRAIRESLVGLLEDEGYEVSSAENGQDALRRLHTERAPDIIVLDLRMPVMDGWEFRAIQKDDPVLGRIPVVAMSADRSPQAVTISAQAYLRKPLDVDELLRAIERILHEQVRSRMADRLEQAERLASLGRVAAGVGHEINNPLTFVLLNLSQALKRLRPLGAAPAGPPPLTFSGPEVSEQAPPLLGVVEMLEDCQVGLERIRQTVGNLQRLSRKAGEDRASLDLRKIIDQSIAIAWNQIRHRARLIRDFREVPPVHGNAASLGQVFLNLLVNAAQAIPEGNASRNEISVATKTEKGCVVVEIRDTGLGISPDVLPHVFEPFFTTKPMGIGTGLGLSISRQTVTDHGGHMDIQSEPGRGSLFRVFLPAAEQAPTSTETPFTRSVPSLARARKRVLVIDDEPLIGTVIRAALAEEHDVVVAHKAWDAFALLGAGETFDLVLCDVVMPDIGGPEVYATLAERWPKLIERLIFMTGGAFTPATAEFIDRGLAPVLPKPFRLDELIRLVRERVPNHD